MLRLIAAFIAVLSLAFAAAAIAPAADSGPRTRVFATQLSGPIGFGRAMYEERSSASKVTQVLAFRIIEADADTEYKVFVNGVAIGSVTTDGKGCAAGSFTNPPVQLPRVRHGTFIEIGPLSGRFVAQ